MSTKHPKPTSKSSHETELLIESMQKLIEYDYLNLLGSHMNENQQH
jgi:hypothetical protein